MKRKLTAILLALVMALALIPAIPAFAALEGNYALTWNDGQTSNNDVNVTWDSASESITVTYLNENDFFALDNINETQGSTLQKSDANGNYQTVSGVTTKIVATGNKRTGNSYGSASGNNFGSVTIKFFSGSSPFIFESGANYGITFDIVANDYHHKSMPNEKPFAFTAAGSKNTTQKLNITLTIDKNEYAPGSAIIATVKGIPAGYNGDGTIAMHEPGTTNTNVIKWAYLRDLDSGGIWTTTAPTVKGTYEIRVYEQYGDGSSLLATATFTVPYTLETSGWAQDEIVKADSYGLIPDSLRGADMTKPITRAEFAAVSVKAYENLTGKTTTPAAANPFTDTKDTEVLKAYNIGLTAGTSATTFDPNTILNREQAATMLTRVLKAAYIPGWTLPTDGNFTLSFTQPPKFADDDKISDWAKPSVYFMAANGIISGTGNNMFSPKATTTAEIAMGYANATREQALAIAVRMVENLKDKPLNFQ